MKFQNVKCAVTVPTFHFCLIIYRECTLDCNQPCAFARQLIEFRNSAATEQTLHSLSWPLQKPNLETWPHQQNTLTPQLTGVKRHDYSQQKTTSTAPSAKQHATTMLHPQKMQRHFTISSIRDLFIQIFVSIQPH